MAPCLDAPWAVDGKRQAGAGDAKEMGIGMSHKLVRFFRRGVQVDGMVDAVMH